MNDSFRIDHVVILVADLDAATADYRDLGFHVVPGGRHPAWGSKNALIALPDGPYLELIAFNDKLPGDRPAAKEVLSDQLADEDRPAVECRVIAWQAPAEGLVDFALLPADIERDIAIARQHGLALEGPFSGGRTRPDGQEVRWQLGIPTTFDVPFLCGDLTDRSLRVPGSDAVRHPNGVTGIARLVVAAADLDDSVLRYRALLGHTPQDLTSDWPRTNTAAFDISGVQVLLAAPADQFSPLWPVLVARGQGPFSMDLGTPQTEHIGLLDPALSHGAHIRLVV